MGISSGRSRPPTSIWRRRCAVTGGVLRGRSPVLARQEAWACLLVYNMITTLAARAAALADADADADEISFTAVLSMVHAGFWGDTCCEHCG